MKKKLEDKEFEISELRRNAKNSKFQEMEVEVKMYIDECTRLRRMLEEALSQLSMGVAPHDLQERYVQQSVQLKNLRKEYHELNLLCEDFKISGKGKRKKDEWITRLKKALNKSKEETTAAQQEV